MKRVPVMLTPDPLIWKTTVEVMGVELDSIPGLAITPRHLLELWTQRAFFAGYNVTHIRTGMAFPCGFTTRTQAFRFLRELEMCEVDWTQDIARDTCMIDPKYAAVREVVNKYRNE